MKGTFRVQNFEIFSMQNFFLTPNYWLRVPSELSYNKICLKNFLVEIFVGTLRLPNLLNKVQGCLVESGFEDNKT
jgi:hypothetical protein